MRRVIFEYTKKRVDLRYEDIVDFVYHRCADLNGNCITKDEWEIVHTLVSEARYLWLIQPFEGVQAFLERLHQKFDLNFATARRAEPVTGSAISKWATALETSQRVVRWFLDTPVLRYPGLADRLSASALPPYDVC